MNGGDRLEGRQQTRDGDALKIVGVWLVGNWITLKKSVVEWPLVSWYCIVFIVILVLLMSTVA